MKENKDKWKDFNLEKRKVIKRGDKTQNRKEAQNLPYWKCSLCKYKSE